MLWLAGICRQGRSGSESRPSESDPFSCQLGVENIGIEIRSVGPADRADLRIYPDFGELFGLLQGSENSCEADQLIEIDLACDPILESDIESVIAYGSGFNNIFQHRQLLQRLDPDQGLLLPRKLPILQELFPMHSRPFYHQAKNSRLQTPFQENQRFHVKDRPLLTIAHMKMRRWMISVVDQNNNSEESADFRHL